MFDSIFSVHVLSAVGKVKVKVKMSLCLTKHHAMKAIGGVKV
jgi:hypothetical protein